MKVGLYFRKTDENTMMTALDAVNWLQARKVKVAMPEGVAESLGVTPDNQFPQGCDVVLSLGGDGTLLRAIRGTAPLEIPTIGINLGHLGYLTEVEGSGIRNCLVHILDGDYTIEKRAMIRGTVMRDNKVITNTDALNDIYSYRNILSSVVDVTISVGSERVGKSRADGLIICTPTGSTAYSLAAGGPIIDPDSDVFGLTLICPHRIDQRPVIIPADKPLTVEFDMSFGPASLFADGELILELKPGDQLKVTKSPNYAHLIRLGKKKDFYGILAIKFNWSN